MQTYRIAVCDDDPISREEICRTCREILTEEGIAYTIEAFPDGESLENTLEQKRQAFDLLILDIQMKEISGMDLAKTLRARDDRVSIVFVSGNEQYLREGYQIQPIHFLLKPLDREQMREALRIDWKLNHRPNTVFLEKGTRRLVLRLDQMVYAETNGNHGTRFILKDQEPKEFPMGLTELERRFPPDRVIRCHNSYLVNLMHVREMKNTAFLMDNDLCVPIGRKYYSKCQGRFIDYISS